MSNSVSVSLLGDKSYRDALAVVAKRHKQDVGALVREALDRSYGREIDEILSFFGKDVEHIQQSLSDKESVSHANS